MLTPPTAAANQPRLHIADNALWEKINQEARKSPKFNDKFQTWIAKGDTVFLRDEICAPFWPAPPERRSLNDFNEFAEIDSGGMHFRESTDLAHLYTK